MAMNKKELEYVERLKTQCALHFTPEVLPDLDIPTDSGVGVFVNGYSQNVYALRVEKSCSKSSSHGLGRWYATTSSGGIKQYSLRLLALKAMRNAAEREFASKLRMIDRMIENEEMEGDNASK